MVQNKLFPINLFFILKSRKLKLTFWSPLNCSKIQKMCSKIQLDLAQKKIGSALTLCKSFNTVAVFPTSKQQTTEINKIAQIRVENIRQVDSANYTKITFWLYTYSDIQFQHTTRIKVWSKPFSAHYLQGKRWGFCVLFLLDSCPNFSKTKVRYEENPGYLRKAGCYIFLGWDFNCSQKRLHP